ncbi:acyl-CoA dehydrogenase family protein [Streptomyces sp. S.PB5]|uniref:acyl-CoA dehydrogenase family protein n=1 Tax=Streptomyces sp. S.PB5 TaxID=3020844 RepID=UPI0025AF03ED|nr:acyl-CoA dehydrogenase family protein [Streptomyces sp. S.PB5]MDN3029072.1 acyl-CoA/acyl-ACP dehydrogenase [Streptomyces sp. S.PB5]
MTVQVFAQRPTTQPLTQPTKQVATQPAAAFLTALTGGAPSWDTWRDALAPERVEQPAEVARLLAFLDTEVDPDAIDREGEIPPFVIARLRDLGAFRLATGEDLGGLGLTPYALFRTVEAVASRSVAIGFMLAVHNGIGVATSLLPTLPHGSLRDLIRRRSREGMISGFADAEPAGQGNQWPRTKAVPTPDGSAYVLTGDKLFISNGPVADLLGVTVTVRDEDGPRVGLAVVDTRSPGFEVRAGLEYLGVRGLPNGWLRLNGVTVPRDHVVTSAQGDPRRTPERTSAFLTARMLIQAAPALALARNCLRWSREFTARRRIDGIGLGEYDLIQRTLAANAADVRAMDAVVRWSLGGPAPGDRWFERMIARNFCTEAATRVVDRTVSLLGAEGLETDRSKRRRGAPSVPLERAYRDIRMLRTAGGVDDLIDVQAAQALLTHCADTAPTGLLDNGLPGALPATENFFPRNARHLYDLHEDLARFAAVCHDVAARPAGERQRRSGQYPLLLLGRIARELLGAAAVLATAEQDGHQRLTDVHCTAARSRLRDLWAQLDAPDQPDHAGIARAVLSRDRHVDDLLGL